MNWVFAVPGVVALILGVVYHYRAMHEEEILKRMTGKVGNVKYVEERASQQAKVEKFHQRSALLAVLGVLAVALGPYFFELH